MKILKFSGEFCVACKVLTSQLEGYKDYDIDNLDMTTDTEKFQKYAVRKLPTLIAVDSNGTELCRKIGSCTLSEFKDWVKQTIQKNDKKLDV